MSEQYFEHYLDGMFAPYPNTPEVAAARTDLHAMMQDKYDNLVAGGVSSNAAIGQVISEFGDLSEVAPLISFNTTITTPQKDLISAEEAHDYLVADYKARRANGVGAALIMSCAVPLILLGSIAAKLYTPPGASQPPDSAMAPFGVAGITILLLMLGFGVFTLAITNNRLKRFRHIIKGLVYTTTEAKEEVYKWRETHSNRPGILTAVGVALCVMSPIPLIGFTGVANEQHWLPGIGVAIMLSLLAVAVNLFISDNGARDAEKYILQEGPFAPEERSRYRMLASLNIAYWLIVVAVYIACILAIGANIVIFTPIYWLMAVAIFYLGRTYINRRHFPEDYSF
ncbi:MAG TPA: hypothetical protein GX530_05970 [Corynebacteriales bacterium]|nr:hypothetical protein [Mycobacteriales bacterium]